MKYTRTLLLAFFIFNIICSSVNAQEKPVLLVEMTGTIDQASVEMLTESIQEAKNQHAQAIILELDTPGGGLQQTFDIAELIQQSTIPIIGYVSPKGASAWSAGTFILISTHLAAMANHTIIGSCQPVEIGVEGTRYINESKVINALVEWIQERASMYGRNETVVAEFVTKNRNVNASEALDLNVIEVVAPTIDRLLEKIDGITITTISGNVTLTTQNVKKIRYCPSLKIQFLKFFSNPILTSLLLIVGILALIFGISAPGFGAEVFGIIAILLSLIGSGFSIPALSIIFIIIGCLLLIIELFVTPGFGIIGIGGILSLIIGSIFLVPSYPNREWLISRDYMLSAIIIIFIVVAILAVFFGFLLYKILQIRTKKTQVGTFIGGKGKTIDRLIPEKTGYIRFKGEYWEARSEETIEPNIKVIIVGKDESTLIVKSLTKH